MFRASRPLVCLVSCLFFVAPVFLASPAGAQPSDAVGVRASGMGGAFTAVADDATASWWNPAGMAGGAYFNALIEAGNYRQPDSERTATGDPQNALRANTRSFAVAFPALGLSYYRLRISQIQPGTSTGTAPPVRQEGGVTEVRLRSLVLNQFGASVAQSLGSHLVIGSTFKLVSAGAASQFRSAAASSLDAADDIDPPGDFEAGLDIGAMAMFGRARFGVMVRTAKESEFGSGIEAFKLSRHARVGAAVSSGTRGVIGTATVALLFRACPQLSQTTLATRWTAARKLRAVFSYRVAMARNCLILAKKFSIRWRAA